MLLHMLSYGAAVLRRRRRPRRYLGDHCLLRVPRRLTDWYVMCH